MDIEMMTRFARAMVLEWGMSERLGFVNYGPEDNPNSMMPTQTYSDETARIIDEEVKRFADEAYADAKVIIDANWTQVVAVAESLLKYETVDLVDVEKIMRGEALTRPTVAELLERDADQPTVAPDVTHVKPVVDGPEKDLPGGMIPSPA
jgi:cell division protease FtsH